MWWLKFFGFNSSENFKEIEVGRATELLSRGCINVNENPLLPLPHRLLPSKIWETLQNKHGEIYHQDIPVMEYRYQSSFGPNMMGDCCWTERSRNKKGFWYRHSAQCVHAIQMEINGNQMHYAEKWMRYAD